MLGFELIVFFVQLSSVTHGTVLQALDFVFLHELPPQFHLVGWHYVIRIENLRFRPNVFLRLPVAIEAPGHVQRALAVGQRHFRNLAVASGAADSFAYVDTVIEIYEVGQRVYSRPGNGFIGAIAGTDRLEHGGIGPNLRMAGHASLCRRKSRE